MTETNSTLKTLGLIITGFVAGFGVSQFLSKDSIFSSSDAVAQCTTDQWQKNARSSDWTPKSECPAYPLQMRITSPGAQTFISPDKDRPNQIKERIVVTLSRPLPEDKRLYLAAQEAGTTNLYISDDKLYKNSSGTSAHSIGPTDIGFSLLSAKTIQIWVFATDDDDRIGDLYGGIQQLREGTPNIYVSEPITLNVKLGPTASEWR